MHAAAELQFFADLGKLKHAKAWRRREVRFWTQSGHEPAAFAAMHATDT
jgi:hypothetical protein